VDNKGWEEQEDDIDDRNVISTRDIHWQFETLTISCDQLCSSILKLRSEVLETVSVNDYLECVRN